MKQHIIDRSMKPKNVMNKIKLILSFLLFFLISCGYCQEGHYVDKDYRIKKYQKEMIKVLIDNKWFEKREKGDVIIKNYSGDMGVTKCIEVFSIEPQNNNILLVRFYSLGTHAINYWGFIAKNCSYFFYYDNKNKTKIEEYMKKYDEKTQKILLDYVKIYTEWYAQ